MESETEPGLMAQIQALIAPPPSETPPKPKRKDREEKRKRGQNRDACDACGECGSLVCCEKCPAALHSRCMEPPLEEDEVPLGEWLCRVCQSKTVKPKEKKCLESEQKLLPFELLIKAVEQQNPMRFTLDRRMNQNFPFPGTEKGPKKVAARRSSSLKKSAPDPVKTCFECRRGARVAALVQCDYCSSSYHLDCLDPPLTSAPLTMWMCPNHPEHYIDANLLTTTSGVERAKLWEQVARDFDQEAVKLEFIRKATRKNPPFRYKLKKPDRVAATIPASVKFLYEHPLPRPPILPNNIKYPRTWKSGVLPTQTEKSKWLSGLFALQLSIAADLFKDDEKLITDEETCKVGKKLNRTAVESFFTQLEGLRISAPLDEQVAKMDPRLLKLLAVQGLKQIMPQNNGNTEKEPKVKIKEEPELNDAYAVFDENLFLKNGVLCTKKKYVALKDINNELKVEEWKELKKPSRPSTDEERPSLAAVRAALAPIGSLSHIAPATMRGKTLTIGTNPDSDVCLTDYGVCQFVSPKHAVIFYDAMTGEYELLNYSQYGSTIDGCLYCIDGTQCRVPSAPSVADPLTQSVRAMLDKRRGLKREMNATPSAVPVQAIRPVRRVACGCGEKSNDVTGWEGSALLHHCSLLQFGCLQFVFSVADFAPGKIQTAEDVEKKKKRVEENGDVVKTELDVETQK